MPKTTTLRTVFWAVWSAVTLLALLPVANPSLDENYGDKINHIGAFAFLLILR